MNWLKTRWGQREHGNTTMSAEKAVKEEENNKKEMVKGLTHTHRTANREEV